jgi:hypothetical protein
MFADSPARCPTSMTPRLGAIQSALPGDYSEKPALCD